MRKLTVAFLTLEIFFSALAVSLLPMMQHASFGATSYPAYAKAGGYAFYSGNGGYIAFLSGVSGNISYFVTNVYSNNNTMRIWVNANLSFGTEVNATPSVVSENLTDSIFEPRILPAVPAQNLTSSKIIFQNITCTYVTTNANLVLPAGTFNATEFRGRDVNGTILDFWFDRSTGLAIEMSEPSAAFQLVESNIAIPLSTQSPFQAELPFILVFVGGWVAAGLLFYGIRRHYLKKSEREGYGQNPENDNKGYKQKRSDESNAIEG